MKKTTAERIVDYIEMRGQVSAKEIGDYLKTISMRAVRKQLKKLLEKGVLRKMGKPPKVNYLMSSSAGPQAIIEKVRPVLRKHNVIKADLFGSAVTGDMKEDSDVDILVQMPDRATLFGVGRLKIDLGQALSREVDVVEYEAVHPYIKDAVFSSKISIDI